MFSSMITPHHIARQEAQCTTVKDVLMYRGSRTQHIQTHPAALPQCHQAPVTVFLITFSVAILPFASPTPSIAESDLVIISPFEKVNCWFFLLFLRILSNTVVI